MTASRKQAVAIAERFLNWERWEDTDYYRVPSRRKKHMPLCRPSACWVFCGYVEAEVRRRKLTINADYDPETDWIVTIARDYKAIVTEDAKTFPDAFLRAVYGMLTLGKSR